MTTMKYILPGIVVALLISLITSVDVKANSQLENRMKLLGQLDMLDALDFSDEISAANKCTSKRAFDCARAHIDKASKLVQSQHDRNNVKLAQINLDGEIELVRLEEIARLEELARIERERIRQEQLRLAREEEARRRKQAEEERSTAAWLGYGARMLGAAAGASAAGTSFDTQAWGDISVGAMEDSMDGGTGMSGTSAALDKTAQRYRQQNAAYRQTGGSSPVSSSGSSTSSTGSSAPVNAREHYLVIKGRSDLRGCGMDNKQADAFCNLANVYYDKYVESVGNGHNTSDDIYDIHKRTVRDLLELMRNSQNRTTLSTGESESGACNMPKGHAANDPDNWQKYNECRRSQGLSTTYAPARNSSNENTGNPASGANKPTPGAGSACGSSPCAISNN